MDVAANGDGSLDPLAVEQESLPHPDRWADSLEFWTAVDCLRADEHPAAEAPARECVTGEGVWVSWDPHTFTEDMTGELWCNRVVTDPENDR